MSALAFHRYIVECDGCHARHGEPDGRPSVAAARAAAYADGWRFPAMVLASGKPSSSSSDVCPTCIPSWTPARWGSRRGSGRILRKEEAPSAGHESPVVLAQAWPETKFAADPEQPTV